MLYIWLIKTFQFELWHNAKSKNKNFSHWPTDRAISFNFINLSPCLRNESQSELCSSWINAHQVRKFCANIVPTMRVYSSVWQFHPPVGRPTDTAIQRTIMLKVMYSNWTGIRMPYQPAIQMENRSTENLAVQWKHQATLFQIKLNESNKYLIFEFKCQWIGRIPFILSCCLAAAYHCNAKMLIFVQFAVFSPL